MPVRTAGAPHTFRIRSMLVATGHEMEVLEITNARQLGYCLVCFGEIQNRRDEMARARAALGLHLLRQREDEDVGRVALHQSGATRSSASAATDGPVIAATYCLPSTAKLIG